MAMLTNCNHCGFKDVLQNVDCPSCQKLVAKKQIQQEVVGIEVVNFKRRRDITILKKVGHKKIAQVLLDGGHIGLRNSITFDALTIKTGIDKRQLQENIAEMVILGFWAISLKAQKGVFLMNNADEQQKYVKENLSLICKVSKKIKDMRRDLKIPFTQLQAVLVDIEKIEKEEELPW